MGIDWRGIQVVGSIGNTYSFEELGDIEDNIVANLPNRVRFRS